MCTGPGSPQGRCALGRPHAPARWGPGQPRLNPAGTPGGGRRALHAGFSSALVQTSPTEAPHTRARTAAPPSRLRFKAAAPAASGGDAAARRWWWQGGRHGQPTAIRNPFVRSRGGEPDSAAGPRGARGGVFPESQHGAALRPPARGLERQNRKRRPRLIHSLRARGSAGGGRGAARLRDADTRGPLARLPGVPSPFPARPCAPPRGSIRAKERPSERREPPSLRRCEFARVAVPKLACSTLRPSLEADPRRQAGASWPA